MPNSIGNAALVLSTSGGKLTQGLESAGSEIKGWAQKASASTGGALAGIGGRLAGFLKGGPHIAAIAAIGTTIYEAISQPFDKLKELGGIQKQADTLGISASQLQGLTKQLERVGIEGEGVSQTFAQMGKNVADAAGGHGRAAPALKQLGIDAKALLHLPVDEQFKAIADAIAKLPPGAEQASAALHIFGGQGAALLPILQKGGSGIQQFIEQQKKVGAVLSDSQIKAAADAQKAWKESKAQISAVWDGLVNRATLIAAPVIKFIGGVVSKAFQLLTPVFEWLGRAIGRAAEILTAVFEVFSGWVSEAIDWLKELVGSVFSFGDTWVSVEDVVFAVLKAMGQAFGYLWDTIKAGAGAIAWVVSWIVTGFGKLVDAFKNTLKELLELAGELPDDLGGAYFKRQAKEVDKWGGGIKRAGEDMRKWGENAMNSFGQSAEKIGSWFDRIKNKRKEDKAEAKKDAAEIAAALPEYKAVAAMTKGSKEAYSVEARFSWEGKMAAEKKKIEEKNNDELKKVNQKLDKVIQVWGMSIPLTAG